MAHHNECDFVLSIEVSESDALYRALRIKGDAHYLVYVEIEDISNNYNYTHLKLSGSKTDLRSSSPNYFQPKVLLPDIARYELFQLDIVETMKRRISLVTLDKERFYMKLAVFPYHLRSLANGTQVCHVLRKILPWLTPRFAAYAYEQTPDRITQSRAMRPYVLVAYVNSTRLAPYGDLNRQKTIINRSGIPVFVDLENSTINYGSESLQRNAEEAEERDLVQGITDDSGRGAPYSL
ncbi:MAG: hypothetical protein FE78DRAFT_75001 [Acidomyces sp. 'richmondensis']|nr:MAG: hypothetical protein FE78DRAFT_75001 [Acidomyces sp. 'richmondensis']